MFLKTSKTYFVEVVLTTIGLIFNMFQINYSHPRVVSEYAFSVSLVKMGSVVQTLELGKNIETYSWYIHFLNTNVPFLFHSFLTDSLPLNRPNYSSPIALFALTNFTNKRVAVLSCIISVSGVRKVGGGRGEI